MYFPSWSEGYVVKMENLSDKVKNTYYAQLAIVFLKSGSEKMDENEYSTVISIYKKRESHF
ncbi:MAG: hypothetical protein PUK70_04225 [Bacteroidales bacterium]|nr:hypothetical protein [Bacteroidales bacterium]MDY6001685.1 hypothetical protein [Candidatus Cryptobacteroides sp.]